MSVLGDQIDRLFFGCEQTIRDALGPARGRETPAQRKAKVAGVVRDLAEALARFEEARVVLARFEIDQQVEQGRKE
jgi:hypothetical protein